MATTVSWVIVNVFNNYLYLSLPDILNNILYIVLFELLLDRDIWVLSDSYISYSFSLLLFQIVFFLGTLPYKVKFYIEDLIKITRSWGPFHYQSHVSP